MQANIITLAVDTANTGSTTDLTLTRHSEEMNKATYIGDDHVTDSRDQMSFHRSAPKPSGQSRGMQRSTIKFTKDFAVPNADGSGNIVLPLILEVGFTVPVGTPSADVLEMRQRVVAICDDDTICDALNDTLEI
jgi:hypothetical protein